MSVAIELVRLARYRALRGPETASSFQASPGNVVGWADKRLNRGELELRFAFLAVGLVFSVVLVGSLSIWIIVRGPGVAWTEFVDFSNQWGNVASVLGLILTVIGFTLTFYGFSLTLGEQNRIRKAVANAIERAASSILLNIAEEAERLLLDFKDAVRRAEWLRAGQKCDDAEARVARMLGNPHLVASEDENLATGVDDLRLVSRYITREKILKPNPARRFHDPKLAKVDRLIASLRTIRARIHNRVWEV